MVIVGMVRYALMEDVNLKFVPPPTIAQRYRELFVSVVFVLLHGAYIVMIALYLELQEVLVLREHTWYVLKDYVILIIKLA
jgi:hypothetical protein